jgi:predicted metal-dependent hydrolase
MRASGPAWQGNSSYREGLRLFNRGAFFEAHEVLVDLWRTTNGPGRQFLQGIIQLAVALHLHGTGNREGASSVLARAMRNLEPYPAHYGNIDLQSLRASVHQWQLAIGRGQHPCPIRIELIKT